MAHAETEEREVTWTVLDDIPVYGTVTAPLGAEASPGVIFLAGSGPTDRNWCSPLLPGTNGSAKILAELLARKGFVTLRYDKLGSGPHVKENLPKFRGKVDMKTFRDELSGAIETTLSQKGVSQDSIFALTNSEGAIHAVNYELQAKTNSLRGMVLTGAPGRAVGDVARSQLLAQGSSVPGAETMLRHYDEAITEYLAGKPMLVDDSLPEGLKVMLRSLEHPNNLPFARELWAYSLPEQLARLDEPMLIVIGKKDIQVDWKVDGKALETAARKNPSASFAYPDNANHVLKHEELPIEKLTAEYVGSHYNAPDARLDEGAADLIVKWLQSQVRSFKVVEC